ncbi:hypothetical protein ASG32_31015 [Methylobacterium sp. Leaf361]|uniref:hypothetical protein n=1 Tax=Methylobacterium sp. Leaf361 TaxID=1736352 RepID=UPI0006FF497C|nr:hypothetical protein [Methylobacterium sp. Leaf361]KQS65042.1 hypothetical protein ASG32_31015 [Methylobacterium sp. Leaf361]
MNPPSAPILAAADALLRVIVKADRQRFALKLAAFRDRPLKSADQPTVTDELDLAATAADPVGTACRATLRRLGHALHAANPDEDFVALSVEVAEMDPTHTNWRARALETAWRGIGRDAA